MFSFTSTTVSLYPHKRWSNESAGGSHFKAKLEEDILMTVRSLGYKGPGRKTATENDDEQIL